MTAVTDLARYLDAPGGPGRMLFRGNLVRQPVFHELTRRRPRASRQVGSLNGADAIMRRALFIGVYPGLSEYQVAHCVRVIVACCRGLTALPVL